MAKAMYSAWRSLPPFSPTERLDWLLSAAARQVVRLRWFPTPASLQRPLLTWNLLSRRFSTSFARVWSPTTALRSRWPPRKDWRQEQPPSSRASPEQLLRRPLLLLRDSSLI